MGLLSSVPEVQPQPMPQTEDEREIVFAPNGERLKVIWSLNNWKPELNVSAERNCSEWFHTLPNDGAPSVEPHVVANVILNEQRRMGNSFFPGRKPTQQSR